MAEDWAAVQRTVFQPYEAGDYAAALAAANAAAERHPERDFETSWWRGCLHARLGETREAMDILEAAVARGAWFDPADLRGDEDLATVQDLPEFAALVAECGRRLQHAEGSARPDLVVLEPASETKTLVFALHGRMGNAREFAERWRAATAAAVVALPQSSQPRGPEMFCWDDRARAEPELRAAYEEIARSHEIEDVVTAGFSQGGIFAIALALAGDPIAGRGFIAVAPSIGRPGMPDLEELVAALPGAAARGVRGVIFTGANDARVDAARELGEQAAEAGFELRLEIDAGLGHDFPDDFDERVVPALRWVLR